VPDKDVLFGSSSVLSLLALQGLMKPPFARILHYGFDMDGQQVDCCSDPNDTHYPRVVWGDGGNGHREARALTVMFDDGDKVEMEAGNFNKDAYGDRWWLEREGGPRAPADVIVARVRTALHGCLDLESTAMRDLQSGHYLTSDMVDAAVSLTANPSALQPVAGQCVAVVSSTLAQMVNGSTGAGHLSHVAEHLLALGGSTEMVVHHVDSGQDKPYGHWDTPLLSVGVRNIRSALLAAGAGCGTASMRVTRAVSQHNDVDCGLHLIANAGSAFEEITNHGSFGSWHPPAQSLDDMWRMRFEVHELITTTSEHQEGQERGGDAAAEGREEAEEADAHEHELLEVQGGDDGQGEGCDAGAWEATCAHCEDREFEDEGASSNADSDSCMEQLGGGAGAERHENALFLLVPFNAQVHWSLLVVELRRSQAPKTPPSQSRAQARTASQRTTPTRTPTERKKRLH
jgi:hypothetical protein